MELSEFLETCADHIRAGGAFDFGDSPLYDPPVSKEMVLENTDVNRSNRPDSAVLSCPNSVPSFGQDGESGNASRTTLTGVFNILPTLRLKTPGDLKVSSTEQAMTAQVATISATPDLEIIEGQITTTSNQVAAHFGKRHADVIRAIRKLESPADFNERNFALVEVIDAKGEKRPAYRITRDGFTLLAMGFTGKEAMQWKLAYLAAFNKMEQELLARTTRPHNPALDYDRISPAQAQDLKELVHAIADSKVQGFGETWARLHRKFRVNSYLELPATRFEEARDYLLGKLPEKPTTSIDAADGPALAAARKVAMDYLRAFRTAAASGQPAPRMDDIPQDVLEGLVADALLRQRMLVSFDYDTGSMQTKLVPSDASVISLSKGDYTGLVHSMPMQRLPELAEALNKRVASHLGAFSQHLQNNRPALRGV